MKVLLLTEPWFEWHLTLGDALVALGTLALAGFTWVLARQTARSVDQGQQEIEALDMPYVIATPSPGREVADGVVLLGDETAFLGIDGKPAFVVRLWNIGRGPAIVTDVQLDLLGETDRVHQELADIPIAAGQPSDQRLGAELPALSDVYGSGELRIYYASSSGARYVTTSELFVQSGGPNDRKPFAIRCKNFPRTAAKTAGRSPSPPASRGGGG